MVFPVFLTSGPNEVLVVSGLGYTKPAMVTGGRLVAWPCVHRWRRLSLNIITITIDSPGVYTALGVPIKVTGVAQVKISTQHPEVLELACEHFLEKDPREIESLITATLEGHQRGIMGTMNVEDIYKNRKLFNARVFEVASRDLCNLGLQVLSYTIKDLKDDLGYLEALGRGRTAEVQRDARIGEAMANRDASIRRALANEELVAARYANNTLKAQAERDFMLKKAVYDQEVNTKKAEADLAYELQACKTKQKIKEEQMEMRVVERKAKIHLEDQEIQRRQKQLESTVMQLADAEKYRLETIAAAQKQKAFLEAESHAEAQRLRGEAEAFAIQERARAEATKMSSKADAWKEYGEAAILDMYLKTMPQMISKVSSSLSHAKSIKMVSSGDSSVGAMKLTKEVIDITSSVPTMVKDMTGIDLLKSLRSAA